MGRQGVQPGPHRTHRSGWPPCSFAAAGSSLLVAITAHSPPLLPPQYLDYKALKDLIKRSVEEYANAGVTNFSPRTTSLTVQRATDKRDSAEEQFFSKLEAEVEKIGGFTAQLVAELRGRLQALQTNVKQAAGKEEKEQLLEVGGLCGVCGVCGAGGWLFAGGGGLVLWLVGWGEVWGFGDGQARSTWSRAWGRG